MPEVDPEQLIRQLEREMAEQRAQSGRSRDVKNAYRIWSLVLIIGVALAALWMLEIVLSSMPKPQRNDRVGAETSPHPAGR